MNPTEQEVEWKRDIDEVVALGMLHAIANAHTVASEYRESAKRALKVLGLLSDDRDEWKRQHENLLSVRASDIAVLNEKIESLSSRLAAERKEAERRLTALKTIAQWDCLNPPRGDLLADLPWLRRIVDAAIAESTK